MIRVLYLKLYTHVTEIKFIIIIIIIMNMVHIIMKSAFNNKYSKFCAPWHWTPAFDLSVQVEPSVLASEQLNREASEPIQVTLCRYTGFWFPSKPPLAMAPGIQSKQYISKSLHDNVMH